MSLWPKALVAGIRKGIENDAAIRAGAPVEYIFAGEVMLPKSKVDKLFDDNALAYGAWLRDNCLVTRDGFRGSRIENWNIEMTNEEAYEMYLESLKDK